MSRHVPFHPPAGGLHPPRLVAHCDWSKDARKRWMATAVREAGRWRIEAPEPVGETGTLLERLGARSGAPGAVLAGFDFPIGLPLAYGLQTAWPGFRQALAQLGSGPWAQWFEVCDERAQIAPARPFYPAAPGGRKREHLLAGLGLASMDELLRRCERATAQRPAACSLFWTLGGNQVGKAAISGWREVLQPRLADIALWPFDGALGQLLAHGRTIVAETYPGDTYGRLGIGRQPRWSKRTQAGRVAVAPRLLDWLARRAHAAAPGLRGAIAAGLGPDAGGEDRFDALVGLFGMLDVVDGHQPEGMPHDPDELRWEGWILGQAR